MNRLLLVLALSIAVAGYDDGRPEAIAAPSIVFEANAGQASDAFEYIARTAAYDVGFGRGAIRFMPRTPDAVPVTLTFGGAAVPRAEQQLATRVNYLRGRDPRQWQRGVATFGRVRYHNVQPGVDVVFYGTARQIEYDIVAAPHADPTRVRMRFEGADRIRLSNGDLLVESRGQRLLQKRPDAYQEQAGRRTHVATSYIVADDGSVGVTLGAYDRSRPVTVDPMIVMSGFFGGRGADLLERVVWSGGALYLAGQTCSPNFPTNSAAQTSLRGTCDGFVTKMTGDASAIVYSTYFGGNDFDIITGLAVDASGAAYIGGYTSSIDLPTTANAFSRTCAGGCRSSVGTAEDAFVAKISPSGSSLAFSTYVGGTADDIVEDLALDAAGQPVIVGSTGSSDYPTTAGAIATTRRGLRDAMITKVAADGSHLVFSTYFGGSSYNEHALGVAVDAAGHTWVVGDTDSGDLPILGAFQPSLHASRSGVANGDAFVAELNASGGLERSSYLGGDGVDTPFSIATDAAGIFIGGRESSSAFPGASAARGTSSLDYAAFVSQLAPDGSHVVKTQLVDGNNTDTIGRLLLTRGGGGVTVNAVGTTFSTNLPVARDALQTALTAATDGSGDLLYATLPLDAGGAVAAPSYLTYLGGRGFEGLPAIAADGSDGVFIGTDTDGAFPRVNASATIHGAADAVLVHLVPPARWTESVAGEVHLYAANAQATGTEWSLVADPMAANCRRAANVDRGAPKIPVPLSTPASYVEFTFQADANTPYRLWIRGVAAGDSYNNDSVYAQFSDSVDSSGHPLWRIGSTSATTVILEDCSGCGVHGWGWADNGYGTHVLGPTVRFERSGTHTLRFQAREDGLSIDQVVLSSAQFLNASPGLTKDDTTVLRATVAATSSAGDCTTGEVVAYAAHWTSALLPTNRPSWAQAADPSAAAGARAFYADTGAPKANAPSANPASWFEVQFSADANVDYRLWLRMKAQNDFWANDSVWVQFSDAVDANGQPEWRIGTASGAAINLEDCSGCGVSSWGWQDDGYGANVLGPLVRFASSSAAHRLRVQIREDGASVDQIVLSSGRFVNAAPGSLKNDATILPECPAPPLR